MVAVTSPHNESCPTDELQNAAVYLNPNQSGNAIISDTNVNNIISESQETADLNKIIKLMAAKQKEDDQVNEILRDWKMLAQKLDYFLFWVFLTITSMTSLLFIFILPYHNRGKLL